MTRQKKSRKSGPLAPRKVDRLSVPKVASTPKKAKGKGRPAGSRLAPVKPKEISNQKVPGSTDPRHGSKKPIPLAVSKAALTPAEAFAAIEDDERLQSLLARIEDGQVLNKTDQAYVDSQLERYQALAAELGIDLEAEDDDREDDDDWEYDTSDMLDEDLPDLDKS